MIKPVIDRTFGILAAEDDSSSAGPVPYRAAAAGGAETDLGEVRGLLHLGATLLAAYLDRPKGAAGGGTA